MNLGIVIVLTAIETALGGTGVLTGLYSLAIFLPGLGIIIRGLHDTGRSGWWVLVGFNTCDWVPYLTYLYGTGGNTRTKSVRQ